MENDLLMIQLRDGDIDAYEFLFNTYYKALCAYTSQYVPFSDAEEIVQETMLWLWENRESVPDDTSIQKALFFIVKNKAINSLRRTKIRSKIHAKITEQIENENDEPDQYEIYELIKAYNKHLNKLPKKYRESFILSREENMTYKEISDRFDISESTVNYRIKQAIKFLQKNMKEFYLFIF